MATRLLAAVVTLVLGWTCAADDLPTTAPELLQGSWDWNPAQKQSDAIPVILVEHVVIKGDKLTFHYLTKYTGKDERSTWTGTFKLDPKALPQTIDFTPTEGTEKGKTYLGLYELKDSKLRIVYRGPGATRPKDFGDKVDPKTNSWTSFLHLKPTPITD